MLVFILLDKAGHTFCPHSFISCRRAGTSAKWPSGYQDADRTRLEEPRFSVPSQRPSEPAAHGVHGCQAPECRGQPMPNSYLLRSWDLRAWGLGGGGLRLQLEVDFAVYALLVTGQH